MTQDFTQIPAQPLQQKLSDTIDGPLETVLIVEDDEFLEPYWREFFKQTYGDVALTWTASHREADALIQKSLDSDHPFDLIISDIFLEDEETGIELWKKYKDILPRKMILVSAVHSEKFKLYFRNQNEAPLYLQKPFTFSRCVEVIDQTTASTL